MPCSGPQVYSRLLCWSRFTGEDDAELHLTQQLHGSGALFTVGDGFGNPASAEKLLQLHAPEHTLAQDIQRVLCAVFVLNY